MLVFQALNGHSLQQTDYPVRDRLSWMHFLRSRSRRRRSRRQHALGFPRGADQGQGARPFERMDKAINDAGNLPMSGQIVDATLVAAPKQRVTFSRAKPKEDGTKQVDIAIPAVGYKSHVSVDRRHKIIRRHAAAADGGARLREGLIDPNNTAGDVWADTAYRSRTNEAWLVEHGGTSRIHRKKPKGRPMPEATRRANGRKSKVRARVKHVFAEQKQRMGLFIRTIGRAPRPRLR